MKNPEANILQLIERNVSKIIQQKLPANIYFHNLQHTLDVVSAVQIIGNAVGLSYKEYFVVQMAAWLHDLGYIYSQADHEEESAKLAVLLLVRYGLNDESIIDIISCIKATKYSRQPSNIMEKVICDADLYHLSTFGYFHRSQLLRKEIEASANVFVSDSEFLKGELNFLINHSFHTSYGKKVLESRKLKNVLLLKQVRHLVELNKRLKEFQNGILFNIEKFPFNIN